MGWCENDPAEMSILGRGDYSVMKKDLCEVGRDFVILQIDVMFFILPRLNHHEGYLNNCLP